VPKQRRPEGRDPELEVERTYEPDEDAMRRLLELLLRPERRNGKPDA
jgi:hypothetical protein